MAPQNMKQLILAALLVAVVGFVAQSPEHATAQQSPLDISPELAIIGDREAVSLTCAHGTEVIVQVFDRYKILVSCQAVSLVVLDPVRAAEPLTEDAPGVGRGAVPVGDMANSESLVPTVTATPWIMEWER